MLGTAAPVQRAFAASGTSDTQCTNPSNGKKVACITCSDNTLVAKQAECPQGDPAAGGNCSSIKAGSDEEDVSKCDLVTKYIQPFVNFLAALVGVGVVVSIVIGGIQYSSSAGDPSKVTAAKKRIFNAIVALITFLFLYALLNFLIPGGLV